ncbi:hypothetical protein [Paenibacillus pinihumi]|uniref:hypothetical protein n=1 Tax=Paenibacillus pinihumi TaxID=669462 RepID=UPI0003FA0AF7|nr:hypothetical protein [Paenibacillus pinihumi]
MDLDLSGVTDSLQAAGWLLFDSLLYYLLLPLLGAAIVIRGVFRVRGGLFKVIMSGVVLLCFYLFWKFGIQEIFSSSKLL